MDIEIRGRKILLIGNGFDLAHGLPTSYSYFLDFCDKVSRIFTYLMHVDEKVYEKSALNIWEVDDSIKAKLLEWYKRRNEITVKWTRNCFGSFCSRWNRLVRRSMAENSDGKKSDKERCIDDGYGRTYGCT